MCTTGFLASDGHDRLPAVNSRGPQPLKEVKTGKIVIEAADGANAVMAQTQSNSGIEDDVFTEFVSRAVVIERFHHGIP